MLLPTSLRDARIARLAASPNNRYFYIIFDKARKLLYYQNKALKQNEKYVLTQNTRWSDEGIRALKMF